MKRLLFILLLVLTSTSVSAQLELFGVLGMFMENISRESYHDFHVKLTAEPAQMGRVWIDVTSTDAFRDKAVVQKATLGTQTEMQADLKSELFHDYECLLFAYPVAGYVLDGFVRKADYIPGQDMSRHFLTDNIGRKLRSGEELVLGTSQDYGNDPSSDPTELSGYKFNGRDVKEFVAVFREAKSCNVVTQQAGTLADVIRQKDAIDCDNLIVSGPLDSLDILCLNDMTREHRLVRLDLTDAHISRIPEHAFFGGQLYELRLPKSGLQSIGYGAFDRCGGLLRFPIPDGVDVHKYAFFGNKSLDIQVDNDNPDGRTGHFDELQPIPVSERTDLTDVTDVMPQFPGGEAAMQQYLLTNMKYPVVAAENGIKGSVIVQAAIEADGTVAGGAQVVKSVDPSLDREALRLVHAMPKWTPGRRNGQPTPMKVTIVVRFK